MDTAKCWTRNCWKSSSTKTYTPIAIFTVVNFSNTKHYSTFTQTENGHLWLSINTTRITNLRHSISIQNQQPTHRSPSSKIETLWPPLAWTPIWTLEPSESWWIPKLFGLDTKEVPYASIMNGRYVHLSKIKGDRVSWVVFGYLVDL